MRNISEQVTEDDFEWLPHLAGLFLLIAFVPHLLELIGLNIAAMLASYICFPVSMGPFALAHASILVNRMGFTSHMSWISALVFTLIWFALLCWTWRKNRTITMAIGAPLFHRLHRLDLTADRTTSMMLIGFVEIKEWL